MVLKEAGGTGNWRNNQDHPNDTSVKISKNAQKNSGDLKRLGVTQTPVKNLQLKHSPSENNVKEYTHIGLTGSIWTLPCWELCK